MKSIIAIILVVVSIGLFFFQINPIYSQVKVLRAESAQYDDALNVADQLTQIRGDLTTKLASFTDDELTSLEHFMPQNLDTVRVILDVSGIADSYNIQLKDIKTSDSATAAPPAAGQASTYNTTTLSFSFSSPYSNGEQFIKNLEQSLRLMDVVSATVKAPTDKTNNYGFDLTLNTYWTDGTKK